MLKAILNGPAIAFEKNIILHYDCISENRKKYNRKLLRVIITIVLAIHTIADNIK